VSTGSPVIGEEGRIPTPEEMARDAIGEEEGAGYDVGRSDFAEGVRAERMRLAGKLLNSTEAPLHALGLELRGAL
jgi:hypothetical protein